MREQTNLLSWKAFWSSLGPAFTFAGGALAAVFEVSLWLTIPGLAALTTLAAFAVRAVVDRAYLFADASIRARDTITRWVLAAICAHAAAALVFLLRPDLWIIWIFLHLTLGGLTYGAARGMEYLLTRPRTGPPRAVVEAQRVEEQQLAADGPRATLVEALKLQRLHWIRVTGWDPIGGDPATGQRPHGIEYSLQVPPVKAITEAGGHARAGQALGAAEAEQIAVALREVLGKPLPSKFVSISKSREDAGTYALTVLTRDVMADIHPYYPDPEWTSIREPALVGFQANGQPYGLRLDQHGQVVAASTGGKSAFLHVCIDHVARSADAVAWVCGTQKVYDLVADWLEPYMDTDLPLPIDWPAAGARDTIEMLAAAMRIIRWRQAQPMRQRGGWPAIVIFLDEQSFALPITTVRVMFEGESMTLSDLAASVRKAGASAGVYLVGASQRDTADHAGDRGTDINANAGYVVGGRIQDEGALGRLLGDYKIRNPEHSGELLVRGGHGDGITRLKCKYPQTTDPTKPVLHDGPTLADIAWSRRTKIIELDPGSTGIAGPAYAQRHTRMTAATQAYLAGNGDPALIAAAHAASALTAGEAPAPVAAPERPVPAPEADAAHPAFAAAEAALDELLGGADTPPADADETEVTGVPSMVGRQTRAVRILEFVRAAEYPVSKIEIVAGLRRAGDHASAQVITNALTKLVRDRDLRRVDTARYEAAHKHTNTHHREGTHTP